MTVDQVPDGGWRSGGAAARRPSARPARPSRALALLLCAVAIGLGACAVVPRDAERATERAAAAPGGEADRIVAAELAAVLAQTLDPLTTTVQSNDTASDPVVTRLVEALAAQGFGIQHVAADQGAHFLDHERQTTSLEGGDTAIDWRVSVGPVEVRRDYRLSRDGALATAGPLTLAGTRASIERESIAQPGLTVAAPAHERVDYIASLDLDSQGPIISLVTPEIVERVARDAARPQVRTLNGGRAAPSEQGLNASKVEINNLFYDGESNFSSAFDDYERVERRIIVFADDSMNLGDVNKRMIDDFVERTVRRDDVFSLVGCSNGPTALEIGNEGLALGRARRVAEALTARGVTADRIYDEGCWAPVSAGDRFPGRGVVLELWRPSA